MSSSRGASGKRAGPRGRQSRARPAAGRPSEPRRLSDITLEEDEVLVDSFEAILDGVRVRVTAVLERTCVYVDRAGDRRLASKKDVWVEADSLPIRRLGIR